MATKQDLETQAQQIRDQISEQTNFHYNGTLDQKKVAMENIDKLYAQLNGIVAQINKLA